VRLKTRSLRTLLELHFKSVCCPLLVAQKAFPACRSPLRPSLRYGRWSVGPLHHPLPWAAPALDSSPGPNHTAPLSPPLTRMPRRVPLGL
jgi:hypothetical protein